MASSSQNLPIKGEHVYFRAVNAGVEPPEYLSIEDHKLIPYAMDGYPVPNPIIEVDELTVDAGARADFLVIFDTPGEYEFKCRGWNAGLPIPNISYDKNSTVASITITEEEVEQEDSNPAWNPLPDGAVEVLWCQ